MSVADLKKRLDANLERVQSLILLFNATESKGGPTKTDLLRAARPGRQRTRQIGGNAVATWKNKVAVFCSTLLDELERS